jgi:hypothetical protein
MGRSDDAQFRLFAGFLKFLEISASREEVAEPAHWI